MLFTFNYISHSIEKLQIYLDFLFKEVWMHADGDFDAEKLIAEEGYFDNPKELYQIYVDLGNSEGEWADFFNSSIENIYKEFLDLDDAYKEKLLVFYEANNNIEGLCTDKSIMPITYDDIKAEHPSLAAALKSFYGRLYGSSSPFNLKIFGFLNKELIGNYDVAFMGSNNKGICPFCGINHLKGNNHSYREAYDHFIPKGVYPFNSLNFKNLAPMCNECNSTYKLANVPIYDEDPKKINPLQKRNARTFAFYPYANAHPEIKFNIDLKSKDIINLKPEEIDLKVEATDYEEQVTTWMRVFGIDERYKALLCKKKEGISWYNSIIEGYDNAVASGSNLTRADYLEAQLIDAKYESLSSYGFLKSVFLEDCKAKGLFDN